MGGQSVQQGRLIVIDHQIAPMPGLNDSAWQARFWPDKISDYLAQVSGIRGL